MTTINLRHPQAFNSEVFICIAPKVIFMILSKMSQSRPHKLIYLQRHNISPMGKHLTAQV